MSITKRDIFELIKSPTTITLPPPVVNDTRTTNMIRINRTSRGLRRRVYASDDWYQSVVHDYTFRNIPYVTKELFMLFARTYLATAITVVDHLSVSRTMYIEEVHPTAERLNDDCSFTIGVILREII